MEKEILTVEVEEQKRKGGKGEKSRERIEDTQKDGFKRRPILPDHSAKAKPKDSLFPFSVSGEELRCDSPLRLLKIIL